MARLNEATRPSRPTQRTGWRGVRLVLREAQVDAAVARVEPAARDRLLAREEVHALGAVCLRVAEDRVLEATEGVVGDRHGNRHVDADHADLDLVLEAAGRPAVV